MAENEKKKYDDYIESDAVRAAKAALDQQMAQKPGAYQSQWQSGLNEAMDKILNREKFSYDLNGDALYQQYKDRYVQQGKQAMMDTMGSASSLTGGYGNSWAQSAGQQTYHGYLQGLNDKVPELYQMALDKYNMEGQDLLNRYGLLSDREDKDYGRYVDALNRFLAERDFLTDRYDTERNYDYGKYSDNRDFVYAQDRDAVADQQWQAEFDEAIRRFYATADPEVRAAYDAYGKTPEEGTTGTGIGGILSGLLGGNGGTIASVISSILGSTGGKIGGKTSSGYSGTGGKNVSDDIVNQVIRGDWGNGADRKKALEEAGYDYATVQAAVNKAMGSTDGGKEEKEETKEEEKEDTTGKEDGTQYTPAEIEGEIIKAYASGNVNSEDVEQALYEEYIAGNLTKSEYDALLKKHTNPNKSKPISAYPFYALMGK